jgi:hypothetical protein
MSDSDSDSDNDIKITLTKRDFSKMSEQELIDFNKQFDTCGYCQSIGKEERIYKGHTKDECLILQNTRCNWCGGYGHTGKYCKNKGETPLEIRCLFCFRGKMDEHFYMSHTQDKCRFKREYDAARRDGRPIPLRPRSTQPKKNIIDLTPKPKIESTQSVQSTPKMSNNSPQPTQSIQKMYEPTSPYEDNKMYEPTSPYEDNNNMDRAFYLAFLELEKYNSECNQDNILKKLQNENQKMLEKLKNDY